LIAAVEVGYPMLMATNSNNAAPRRRTSIGARRSPEAEAAVLDAARSLISEKGYAGFSVDEVARRAGSGKTTIYRWYPTKADLFIAIYEPARLTHVRVNNTGDLVEELVHYTTSLWRFWASHPAGDALRGLIAEAQGSSEALLALRERFLPDRTNDVRGIFEAGADRGEVSPDQVADKISLWVAFSWFKLLLGELDDESKIPSMMVQISGRQASNI